MSIVCNSRWRVSSSSSSMSSPLSLANGLVGFGAGLTADGTMGEVDVERMVPIGVAGLSVDGGVTAGVVDVGRVPPIGLAPGMVEVERGLVPIGVAGLSEGEVTAGMLDVDRMPMGVAGLSVGVGDIMPPGVAGLGGEVDDDGCGDVLNGDEAGDEIDAAAGLAGAAGLDGTGDDDGGGSLSATVPAITAGPERESACDASAGFGSCVMTICGLGVIASLPGAPGIGKLSL